MKRAISLFIISSLTMSLFACENKNAANNTNKDLPTATTSPKATETNTSAPAPKDAEWNKDVQSFVPAGYSILDQVKGDINLDGVEDLILVLKSDDEDNGGDTNKNRWVYLLEGNKEGAYKVVRKSDKTVLCHDCGGTMGDPYQTIVIKNGYFSIEHYGGSGMRWTRIITYKYDKSKNEWFLHKDGGESFHSSNPDKVESSYVKTTKDFGTVKFEDYDAIAE